VRAHVEVVDFQGETHPLKGADRVLTTGRRTLTFSKKGPSRPRVLCTSGGIRRSTRSGPPRPSRVEEASLSRDR